jgi:hypothetical protein
MTNILITDVIMRFWIGCGWFFLFFREKNEILVGLDNFLIVVLLNVDVVRYFY